MWPASRLSINTPMVYYCEPELIYKYPFMQVVASMKSQYYFLSQWNIPLAWVNVL